MSRRRKKRRPAAAPAPAGDSLDAIRAARRSRLNHLVGQDGPEQRIVYVGSMQTGYSAQFQAEASGPSDGLANDVEANGQMSVRL